MWKSISQFYNLKGQYLFINDDEDIKEKIVDLF